MTVVYQNSDVSVETTFHFKVILDMNKIGHFLTTIGKWHKSISQGKMSKTCSIQKKNSEKSKCRHDYHSISSQKMSLSSCTKRTP